MRRRIFQRRRQPVQPLHRGLRGIELPGEAFAGSVRLEPVGGSGVIIPGRTFSRPRPVALFTLVAAIRRFEGTRDRLHFRLIPNHVVFRQALATLFPIAAVPSFLVTAVGSLVPLAYVVLRSVLRWDRSVRRAGFGRRMGLFAALAGSGRFGRSRAGWFSPGRVVASVQIGWRERIEGRAEPLLKAESSARSSSRVSSPGPNAREFSQDFAEPGQIGAVLCGGLLHEQVGEDAILRSVLARLPSSAGR